MAAGGKTKKGFAMGKTVNMKKKGMAAGGELKNVDSSKNPGLAKLPEDVRNKMGFKKAGGSIKKKKGMAAGGMMKKKGMAAGGMMKKKGMAAGGKTKKGFAMGKTVNMKKKGMAAGGKMKKGFAMGKAVNMKKKGMAAGGRMKKGYANGGQIRGAGMARGVKPTLMR